VTSHYYNIFIGAKKEWIKDGYKLLTKLPQCIQSSAVIHHTTSLHQETKLWIADYNICEITANLMNHCDCNCTIQQSKLLQYFYGHLGAT
jgi:hypothetical protein